jgi:hypothetical protein
MSMDSFAKAIQADPARKHRIISTVKEDFNTDELIKYTNRSYQS